MDYSIQTLLHLQVRLEDAYKLYISKGGDHSKGVAVDNRDKVKNLSDAIKILTEAETTKGNLNIGVVSGSLPHPIIRAEYLKFRKTFDRTSWTMQDDVNADAWFMYGWRKREEYNDR